MTIENWGELFAVVKPLEIQKASKGLISRQLAEHWRAHGLPRTELSGLDNRSRFIIKAAKSAGVVINRDEILALSRQFTGGEK